jgi:hypothetical protein
MKKHVVWIINTVILVSVAVAFTMCGGTGGEEPPPPGSETYNFTMGDGCTLEIISPVTVTCDPNPPASTYPPGSTVPPVSLSGTLAQNQTAQMTIKDPGGRFQSNDVIAYVNGLGSWKSVQSTVSSDGKNISAIITHFSEWGTLDETAPNVIAVIPESDEDEAPVETTVSLTFSETMDESSTEGAFSLSLGVNPVIGAFTWNNDSSIMTFTPSSDLDYNSIYDIELTTAAEDMYGNELVTDFTSSFTTVPVPDTTPPLLSSLNTADVNGNGKIDRLIADFDEPVDGTSIVVGNFSVSPGTISDVVDNGIQSDGIIWIDLTEDSLYTDAAPSLSITADGITDMSGNGIAAVSDFPSTDGAGPAILEAVADDGTNIVVGIDDDDTVTITFSEDTNQPTIDSSNIDDVLQLNNGHTWLDDSDAIGSSDWISPDVLEITLSDAGSGPSVAPGDTITLDGTAITDGNNTATSVPFLSITGSFWVDTVAPSVVSVSPDFSATDVAISTNVTVTFSEPMNQTSVNNAFSLTYDTSQVPGSLNWINSSTVAFDPNSNLAFDTEYSVNITTGAEDLAGNNLLSAFASTFTTESPSYSPEGSIASPVVISVGTTHSGSVDTTSSYYVAAVNVGTTYDITLTNLTDDANLLVFNEDSTFSILDRASWNTGTTDEIVTTQAGGSMMYIEVDGSYATANGGAYFDLLIEEGTPGYPSEGSLGSPVILTVGTPHSGTVDTNASFYQASVTAGNTYQITITNMNDDVGLYVFDTDSTFTTVADYSDYIGIVDEFVSIQATGSTMYIAVGGFYTQNGATYQITISQAATPITVEGTVTIPAAATGAYWMVIVDDDTDFANGYIADDDGTLSSGTTFDYTILNVPTGTYYIFGVVDVDNSMGMTDGDYLGFYGGTGVDPPASANATLPSSGTVTFDFSLGTFTLSGSTYYLETFSNGSGSFADTVLAVYNDSMNMIGFNDDKTAIDYYSGLEIPLESGETYYILVADWYYNSNFYSIRISDTSFGGSSSGTPSDPDGYEPDNDSANATQLTLNVVQDHSLSYNSGMYGDEDWFYFIVP